MSLGSSHTSLCSLSPGGGASFPLSRPWVIATPVPSLSLPACWGVVCPSMLLRGTICFLLGPKLIHTYIYNNSRNWGGHGTTGVLFHCWWECRLVQASWKTICPQSYVWRCAYLPISKSHIHVLISRETPGHLNADSSPLCHRNK